MKLFVDKCVWDLFDLGRDCTSSPALEAQAAMNEVMGGNVLKKISNADTHKHLQCLTRRKQ